MSLIDVSHFCIICKIKNVCKLLGVFIMYVFFIGGFFMFVVLIDLSFFLSGVFHLMFEFFDIFHKIVPSLFILMYITIYNPILSLLTLNNLFSMLSSAVPF